MRMFITRASIWSGVKRVLWAALGSPATSRVSGKSLMNSVIRFCLTSAVTASLMAASGPVEPAWVVLGFCRGCVDEVTVNSAASPTSDAARAFAAAPLVCLGLHLQPLTPWLPHLRHVRLLTLFHSIVTDADAAVLC